MKQVQHPQKYGTGRSQCGVLLLLAVWLFSAQTTIGQSQQITYRYDSLNRLTEVRYPDKVIVYTYDAAGNRTSLVIDNPNPVPALSSLSPNSVLAGGAGFNLIVMGSNFITGSTVQWNGTPRTTSFGSPTQLSASIDAADISVIGTADVTVVNPAPGGGSSNTLIFNITPPCNYSVFPASQSYTSTGGMGTASVVVPNGCNWTGVGNDSWITIDSGSSGSGNGSANYSVAANTGIARTGTLTLAGQTVTITQGPGCSLSLNSSSQSFAPAGGSGSVNITAGTGCDWQAQSNAGFITISSGATGISNGTVNYSVAANSTTNQRMGTMTIAGQIFTVTQAASPTPLSIDSVIPPAGRIAGGQQIKLTGSFANLSTVMMGGVSASWGYSNGTTEVTVTTPPHVVGAVSIDLAPTSGIAYSKSNAFAYLPTVFTDDTLVVAVTTAKAQHIVELRQAVDALRAVAGLGPAPWIDSALLPFNSSIRAIHILELRSYLEDAAGLLGYPVGSYTDPALTNDFLIKRVHIEELRQRIRAIAG